MRLLVNTSNVTFTVTREAPENYWAAVMAHESICDEVARAWDMFEKLSRLEETARQVEPAAFSRWLSAMAIGD